MSPDELTPAGGGRPLLLWRDVVLQLVQSAITVGGALALCLTGHVSGEMALTAIAAAGAPALVRLGNRLLRSTPQA